MSMGIKLLIAMGKKMTQKMSLRLLPDRMWMLLMAAGHLSAQIYMSAERKGIWSTFMHTSFLQEKNCNNLSFSFLLSPSYFQLNTYDIHTYDENR